MKLFVLIIACYYTFGILIRLFVMSLSDYPRTEKRGLAQDIGVLVEWLLVSVIGFYLWASNP